MLGDGLDHGLGGGQGLGPLPDFEGGIEPVDGDRGDLAPGFHVEAGRDERTQRGVARQAGRAVEPLERPGELAPAGLVERQPPGFGQFPVAAERRVADLLAGHAVDPLDRPARVARVEVGAGLDGDLIRQAEPGLGQEVGGDVQPFGPPEVIDRARQVVGLGPPGAPGDQVQPQPVAEADHRPGIGHVGARRQRERLVDPPRPGRVFRLFDSDSPLSQHG